MEPFILWKEQVEIFLLNEFETAVLSKEKKHTYFTSACFFRLLLRLMKILKYVNKCVEKRNYQLTQQIFWEKNFFFFFFFGGYFMIITKFLCLVDFSETLKLISETSQNKSTRTTMHQTPPPTCILIKWHGP